jgi:hypothetical protein
MIAVSNVKEPTKSLMLWAISIGRIIGRKFYLLQYAVLTVVYAYNHKII